MAQAVLALPQAGAAVEGFARGALLDQPDRVTRAVLVHDLRVLDVDGQPELRAPMVRANVALGLLVY